jgi:hypothetical protein
MPLVNFNPQDLIKGHTNDVLSFIQENKVNTQPFVLDTQNVATFQVMKVKIDEIIANINVILDKYGNILHPLTWVAFEYSHDIYSKVVESSDKYVLWLLRHQLCYQILIYTCIILKNKTLFGEIFSKEISKDGYKITPTVFKEGSEVEIDKFKLGIFGSITVTSDIDIGIQYSEPVSRVPGIISYVLKTFEDLFILFTGKSTLKFDIEPYGDMMYFDIVDQNGQTVSYFYCDTTDFDNNDFIELMPEIGASIIRNYIQSQLDLNIIKQDIRRFKINEVIDPSVKNGATQIIKNFGFTIDNKGDIPEFSNLSSIIGVDIFKQKTMFGNGNSYYPWVGLSKGIAADYLLNKYDDTRTKYYAEVAKAEDILAKNIDIFKGTKTDIDTKVIRKQLMKAIALALNYRAESHVSPSTIMHVVRVIQGKENLQGQPCNSMTYPKTKAQCSLGRIGYIISMVENLGFLMRFRLTYCNDPSTKEKCDKKINKYLPRFIAGLIGLNSTYIEKYNSIYSKYPLNIDIINKANRELEEQYYRKMYVTNTENSANKVQPKNNGIFKSPIGGKKYTYKYLKSKKSNRKNRTIRKRL